MSGVLSYKKWTVVPATRSVEKKFHLKALVAERGAAETDTIVIVDLEGAPGQSRAWIEA